MNIELSILIWIRFCFSLYSHHKGVLKMHIDKKYIVDERGNPKEVVILLEKYRKIEELFYNWKEA